VSHHSFFVKSSSRFYSNLCLLYDSVYRLSRAKYWGILTTTGGGPRKQFRERADLRSFQSERPSMSRCLTISQVCRPGGLQFTRRWLCSHFGHLRLRKTLRSQTARERKYCRVKCTYFMLEDWSHLKTRKIFTFYLANIYKCKKN